MNVQIPDPPAALGPRKSWSEPERARGGARGERQRRLTLGGCGTGRRKNGRALSWGVEIGLCERDHCILLYRWRHIERPDFLHPDRAVLRDAERALQTLEAFEKSDQFDPILQDPLTKLRNRIISEVDFIRHREHGIAFIGEIGVGKTTALSFVTNLVTNNKGEEVKSIFPTGSGRTTVCEVAIKIAPAFGIAVDCLTEDQIRDSRHRSRQRVEIRQERIAERA